MMIEKTGESIMERAKYSSDLTGKQWQIIEPLLALPSSRQRRLNMIYGKLLMPFFILCYGCQWRNFCDFPLAKCILLFQQI